MSKNSTATKQKQSKPAPVAADTPIPFKVSEPAPESSEEFHDRHASLVVAKLLNAISGGATSPAAGLADLVHHSLRALTYVHAEGQGDTIPTSYLITLAGFAECAAEMIAIETSRHQAAAMAGGAK